MNLDLSLFLLITVELLVGFALLWFNQFVYRLARRVELQKELFVRKNPAMALALVGYNFGLVIALGGVLGQGAAPLAQRLWELCFYGITAIAMMVIGAWVVNYSILRRFDCAREVREECNLGAAAVEAGSHLANGLVIGAALAGEGGGWFVGLICWLIGLSVLSVSGLLYQRLVAYDVFAELQGRNNLAAGIAFAGLLISVGYILSTAFGADFQTWQTTFPRYLLILLFSLAALGAVRWLADLLLLPGVNISDQIAHQEIPNPGAGLLEGFAYIAAALLISWCL